MGKHGAAQKGRSFSMVVAAVVVCALAIVLGYLMGNYAITAVTTSRHRPAIPAGEPAPSPAAPATPDGAAKPAPDRAATQGEAAAGDSLLTRLEDGRTSAEATAPAKGEAKPAALYRVQVGPFDSRQEAVAASGHLLADGYPTYVTTDRPYRVQVGAFGKREAAEKLVAELRAKNYVKVRLVAP